MATPVVMPQMGESIAEGTIVRWIKKVGDSVDRDEPLFEISTDKVDAEIPSPLAGVILEITVKEGETVPVNSVVATIGAAGEAPSPAASAAQGAPSPAASAAQGAPSPAAQAAPAAVSQPDGQAAGQPAPPGTPMATAGTAAVSPTGAPSAEDLRRQKSSPLVRRIAQEHQVDIRQISGSGSGGRVTKHDILGYIEKGPATPAPAAQPAAPAARPSGAPMPAFTSGNVEVVPMSVMRRKIAENMVLSRRTSAHVHSVFEVSYAQVDRIRQAKKADYERGGAKLTYMAFITKAVIDALRRHPMINASIDGDNIVYKKDVNIGIAVALENAGLIVPVIKGADNLNVLGLSRAIADIAGRARSKKLKPEEVQDGTFTITNPGNFGALFGMPIINQPQVAILGVGNVEKRPVVIDDMIAIRPMGYLTLGYDHRLVDGATADQFMADVKKILENFDAGQV